MSQLVNKINQRVRQLFMFHYPCLLSSQPFKNVEECRTLSKFLELCRTAAQTIDAMGKSDEYAKVEQPWIAATTDRLAHRRGKKPDTKGGQLRALWPEIRSAIAEGQSLSTIRQWLEDEGGIIVTTCAKPRPLSRPHPAKRTSDSAGTNSTSASASNPRLCDPDLRRLLTLRNVRFQYAPVPQTKASASEFGVLKNIFAFWRPAPPPPFPL